MSSVTPRQRSTSGRIRYVDLGRGTWAPEADEAVYSNYIALERHVVTMPSTVGTSSTTVAAAPPPHQPAPLEWWEGADHVSADIATGVVTYARWLNSSAVTPGRDALIVDHLRSEVHFLRSHLEPDEPPPTAMALKAAKAHLQKIVSAWPPTKRLPLPLIETSGGGDILFDWRKGSRNVALTVTSRGRAQQTRGRVNGFAIEEARDVDPASPEHTVEDLEWMLKA